MSFFVVALGKYLIANLAFKAINAFLAAVSLNFDAWSCFLPDSLIRVYRYLCSTIQAHSINTWFIFQTLAGVGQGTGINLGREKYLMSTYRFYEL